MASENQANYAKIGFAVVLGIVLILGALVYLGGVRDVQNEFFAETYFRNGVSGLSVGSAVNFRGVKVGEVREMAFVSVKFKTYAEGDGQTIWVKLALNRQPHGLAADANAEEMLRGLIARGLRATVASSAITGLSRIELDMKEPSAFKREISWTPTYVCIPPAPSIMESAANSVDRILGQIDRIDIVDGWTNVVGALQAAQGALGGVDVLLQTESGRISEILENVRAASASLRDWADQLRVNPARVIWSTEPENLPETR